MHLWSIIEAVAAQLWSIIEAVAAAVGIAAALLGAWWLWWQLPKRQVDRLQPMIFDSAARATAEDNIRKTVSQLFVGIGAALIAASVSMYTFLQQQRETSRQARVSSETNLANQFDKAVERLTAPHETMRVGGVYALENVLNHSDIYNQAAFDTLCEFVRHNSRTERTNNGDGPLATDIQEALKVIGRRRRGPDLVSAHTAEVRKTCSEIGIGRPDLGGAHIPKAVLGRDISQASLGRANEVGIVNLACAWLKDVNLAHAVLYNANLAGAWLKDVNLTHAVLPQANLTGAWLLKAHATGVDLSDADLTGADLTGADLKAANLQKAHLRDANLTDADLTCNQFASPGERRCVDIRGADFTGAIGLTPEQMSEACGDGSTTLPFVRSVRVCSADDLGHLP
jgi:uncharacterized protein YjbI with pentapeptide repeats